MSTIGFFGDSFCATLENKKQTYETYIKKLVNYYSLDVVNLGVQGSSIFDTILLQFQSLVEQEKIPDICVFVWTDRSRLFHKRVRNINLASLYNNTGTIWDTAKKYYAHLYDVDCNIYQYKSALYYFDNMVLTKIPQKIKIIHLWSFWDNWHQGADELYHHKWSTGIEITPALIKFSLLNEPLENEINYRFIPNHIQGEEKNTVLFETIRDAIEGNYFPEKSKIRQILNNP